MKRRSAFGYPQSFKWAEESLLSFTELRGANCFMQTEVQTAGPVVPETSYFEESKKIEIAVRFQTSAGLFQAGFETFPVRSLN